MAGVIEQLALETHLQTRNAPQYRTSGQEDILSLNKFIQSLGGKKKGAIQYSLADGTLRGKGEGFSGNFTADDIKKFSDSQFKDLGQQLGYSETEARDIKVRLFREMN